MSYPFVKAGAPDYGPRKGPALGLLYHLAEGGNTVAYLANNPPRGVSVHAVCDYKGVVTRMLPWTDASGSLNPADRSTDKAYFGHSALVAVLGDWWKDPNSAVLSMEIEGFAKTGPNQVQVAAAIAWGLDMRAMFPALRGALGHADQTDYKGCPGTTPAMKAIFAGVGGHGLWAAPVAPDTSTGVAAMPTLPVSPTTIPQLVSAKAPVTFYNLDGSVQSTGHSAIVDYFSPISLISGTSHFWLISAEASDGTFSLVLLRPTSSKNVPAADCSAVKHELDLANGRIRQAVTALGGTI